MLLYSAGRILFFVFNKSMFPNVDISSFLRILRGGVMFDTSAILFLNALYFLLFLLPFPFKFGERYQRILKWVFLWINSIGLAFNYIDIIYYRFILKRTTASTFDIVSHDAANFKLIFRFFYDFWYIALIWLITIFLLARLYSLVTPTPVIKTGGRLKYIASSFVGLILV